MKKIEKLTEKEMANIIGGKYYGNGVTCGKHSCSVNWGQAFSCSVSHLANFGHGKC
ncbi:MULTISPECIES: leucocin A/sakacin P family class II bacteriocin [Lactobacillaceae]|nr:MULTISPECIES: leucocin A/sakacin P family class II bacteriocin [Lactobacillaceae]MBF7103385.1 leucocin A/sakacin P family class II bacteriocin [Pediococcus pentosaceus]MBF7136978.1 leucocin A/sakacin P family class II bacteriocin [Pediococcus pentosaceus]MBT1145065.1 leucocin A/sakacin P family class II bacteriocin [Lactiplantibacillus argentoratensis]MBT1147938.1 leucocin A/sakacin P family class II bacteriocin [Lactiplantibacillus argentoratensis]MBT1150303.1 leucocin A/sakacin P family c